VFDVVAEVIEERLRETAGRLLTNFTDRGWRLLIWWLLLILCKYRTWEQCENKRQCDSRASHITHGVYLANRVPVRKVQVLSSTVLALPLALTL
jgi:hypothetical protein